jgi:hypothetical protein
VGIQINKALVRSICINLGQNNFTYDLFQQQQQPLKGVGNGSGVVLA